MNLLVKKLRLLSIIMLATVLTISCEDPGRIGLIIDENNGAISTKFEEVVLPSSVVQFNPRKTSESQNIQAGTYSGNDFGKISSKSYTQVSPSLFIQPNDNAIYTGFEMSIGFNGIEGEEIRTNQKQIVSIYQLAEPIDSTKTYYRNDELALGEKLGDWDFTPMVDDTLRMDSTYTLRINDAIGVVLFNKLKAGDPIFESDALFNEYFNGIAFTPGAISNVIYKLDRPKTKLKIKYNEFNSEGTAVPREYILSMGTHGFYNITSDVSGTPLAGLQPNNEEFYPTDDYRYLQYGTMMAIKIDLAPFNDIVNGTEYLIINKAEIILDDLKPTVDNNESPTPLYAYFTDDATNEWPVIDDVGRYDTTTIGNYIVMLQDESSRVTPGVYGFPHKISYNSDDGLYRIDISLFLQNLYSGEFSSISDPFLEEQGKILLFGETSVLFPNRSTSHQLTSHMAVHKDRIRLRLHYSLPNIN